MGMLLGGKSKKVKPNISIDESVDPAKEQNKATPIKHAREEADVPIGNIVPDPDNTRTKYILPDNITKNALSPDHTDYDENQKVIDGIIEFAEQLKVEPLQSRIGVYRFKGRYRVSWGNRRYFAMKLAFGAQILMPCVVYDEKPRNPNTLRFIENFQREGLSFRMKLSDFKAALSDVNNNDHLKGKDIWLGMGMSKTNYYRYKKATNSPVVFEAATTGVFPDLESTLEFISKFPKEDQQKEEIQRILSNELSEEEQPVSTEKPKRTGPRKTSLSIPRITGSKHAVVALKRIIKGDLAEMDWEDLDWDDMDSIQERLNKNIKAIIREASN